MKIMGKEYIEVKDRVLEFNEKYKSGSIRTEIIQQDENYITMRASVYPSTDEQMRVFTGTAQEWKQDPKSMVNKTSFVENCETSAVGRALAMMGIGVVDSIASADEVNIAKRKEQTAKSISDNFPPTNMGEFDSGKVCKKCGRSEFLIEKIAGPSAKRPGAKMIWCTNNNDGFVSYVEDVPAHISVDEIDYSTGASGEDIEERFTNEDLSNDEDIRRAIDLDKD